MKSPFKFPDSYTKDDREIFFGFNKYFERSESSLERLFRPERAEYCKTGHRPVYQTQIPLKP
jgi:hypothetical protein